MNVGPVHASMMEPALTVIFPTVVIAANVSPEKTANKTVSLAFPFINDTNVNKQF